MLQDLANARRHRIAAWSRSDQHAQWTLTQLTARFAHHEISRN